VLKNQSKINGSVFSLLSVPQKVLAKSAEVSRSETHVRSML
jgi:hypothetical protein